jgi:large subunit ribosomal protein L3
VTQVKTAITDGYEAVQLGFGTAKEKNTSRPILGHLGHSLPQTPRQRRKAQQESAQVRQKARQKAATESGQAS